MWSVTKAEDKLQTDKFNLGVFLCFRWACKGLNRVRRGLFNKADFSVYSEAVKICLTYFQVLFSASPFSLSFWRFSCDDICFSTAQKSSTRSLCRRFRSALYRHPLVVTLKDRLNSILPLISPYASRGKLAGRNNCHFSCLYLSSAARPWWDCLLIRFQPTMYSIRHQSN